MKNMKEDFNALRSMLGTVRGYGNIADQLVTEMLERVADIEKSLERTTDLVRYQRHELHEAQLISNEEYADLVYAGGLSDKSVKRLEGYDEIKRQLDEALSRSQSAIDELMVGRAHYEELQQTFELIRTAEARAIEMWRGDHPGSDLIQPDGSELSVWLMSSIDTLRSHNQTLRDRLKAFGIEPWESPPRINAV